MTPQSGLEIKGSFFTHSFGELLAEIAQSRLDGSLRVSDKDKKSVIYFKDGCVVFAVSNARTSRLFAILLQQNKMTRETLVKIPNFENDIEFAASLVRQNLLTKSECDALFTRQIEGIIIDVLGWPEGDWTFSSLARIRDGLSFPVNAAKILVARSRQLEINKILSRFRSFDEKFLLSETPPAGIDLTPDEAFVLSRSDEGILSAASLVNMTAMSQELALRAIYILWFAGFLIRSEWHSAIPTGVASAMRNAKLSLKQEAKINKLTADPAEKGQMQTPTIVEKIKEELPPIALDDYLERVENAATYYDILGVDVKADNDVIKRAYFGLARMFHPDRYHAEGGAVFKRVQNAFTELAQAHETLKNPESREVYDYRVRKELADREKRSASGLSSEPDVKKEKAEQNFDHGFTLLMDQNVADAVPFLARAAHFAPRNARYRAYYGKALSYDPNSRHKAEAEMQAALKIDPENTTFRIMLAEFFINFNLIKRAEGELNRLLAIFPSNREARELLDSLPK